ncbi:hypothetical protein [Lacticaseibacillus kribbianus]|uniref:hypothetical protein n=1 Tax=Lacticaseibacillus kribbianus TaxID=2926292 RepID=UPI001CD7706F|nr:hypothetical protein [Lacticaseibacillus kribbianus]
MTEAPVPRIDSVAMLPNLFLRVTYKDGEVRYVRSPVNKQIAAGASRKVTAKSLGDMMQASAASYIPANAIDINPDNTFAVNSVDYDGDDLYRNGRRSYMA